MWTCYTLLPVLLLSLGAVRAIIIDDDNETRFRCYDGSFNTYYDFNFDDPTPLLNSSCFDSSRDTVIFTYGFQASNTGPFVRAFVEAHLQANYNVILAIWEKYTSAGIGDAGYPIAAANALIYGAKCGKGIALLLEAGLSLLNVRLVGFSLGAHFMGEAAKTCKNAGFTIPLLIGFDPAGPLFTGLLSLGGIGPTDAAFVLIIHTNPGRMGTSESKGIVDLWMNCGNPVQPGCAAAGGGVGITTPENMCSHNRAWEYYIEAGQTENTFIGIIASTCEAWRNGNVGNLTYTLGYNTVTGVQGNFYMSTNSTPPYGRGEAGLNP